MKHALVAAMLFVPVALAWHAAPVRAQDSAIDANAAVMREFWAGQTADSVAAVQQVYSRSVSFTLPRPLLPAHSSDANGAFIMEFVADGQTVASSTLMVTVTGVAGAGAAHLSDAELADVIFNRGKCDGYVYSDLGSVAVPVLPYRALIVGCGAEGAATSERSAIALFRDAVSVWTVQFAQRGAATAGFAARAKTELSKLAPAVGCTAGETMPECRAQ